MTDLRRHSRTPFDCPIVYRVAGSNDDHHGQSRDLSLGGMYVVTPEPPPAFGSTVTVRFLVPGTNVELSLQALVRWSGDGGMGLQFGSLSVRDTHHITNLTRD